jgi:hypothetical protein
MVFMVGRWWAGAVRVVVIVGTHIASVRAEVKEESDLAESIRLEVQARRFSSSSA